MKRPGPLRWLWFVYGGRLPERYREWVLHVATCRTWLVRAFARGLVQLAPLLGGLLGALVVFGGSWPLALGSTLLGFLVALRIILAFAQDNVDARVAQHGFPAGHATAVRRRRHAAEEAAKASAYNDTWRR
ncbi:DUF5313 family protein [Actinokineospora sp. HUAS TT18]|uniref:DUF5313 family protein n=1 Tax=Actinokineospora sp. HUAS TT18 TaxID=3447451 RepID=UPI003F523403